MLLYKNLVSSKFTGTCTMGDQPVLELADHKNDFYSTVDLTIVLSSADGTVSTLLAVFGEDSEQITRDLAYSAVNTVTGTSAKLTVSGSTYRVAGTAQATEDRYGKKTTRLIPFTVKVNCGSKS